MRQHERKQMASYNTPPSLVAALIKSALDPLIKSALEHGGAVGDTRARLLALKVCDPSCGAAAFLLAAARRLARAIACLDADGREPDAAVLRRCVREVIQYCIYGVDLNPLAIELSRLVLWIEGQQPGLPNQFLGHRLKCGNTLVGATPELVAAGLPEGAFAPVNGDDDAGAPVAPRLSPAWWAALAPHDDAVALWRRRLGVMVPLRSQEYAWDGGPTDADRARIRGYLGPPSLFSQEDVAVGTREPGAAESLVAFGGDAVLWPDADEGRATLWGGRVVDALAVLSFAPGGVHLCGLSWQSADNAADRRAPAR